jgi:hypothetical protein
MRGRVDDARKVYKTVRTDSTLTLKTPYAAQLHWNCAEMEWLSGENDAALRVIGLAVAVDSVTGIGLLRTKRSLEEVINMANQEAWKEKEALIKLRALLEMITSSPNSAMAVFDSFLLPLAECGATENSQLESLTMASLVMLYHHSIALKNPMPPVILRERLHKAVEDFPGNTIILGMFLEAEKGQGLWGRVRSVLGETTADSITKEKDVARRVAEVWIAGWEKGRWDEEKERTRGGLSAAMQDDR